MYSVFDTFLKTKYIPIFRILSIYLFATKLTWRAPAGHGPPLSPPWSCALRARTRGEHLQIERDGYNVIIHFGVCIIILISEFIILLLINRFIKNIKMSVKRGKCQIIKACNLSGKKTKTTNFENWKFRLIQNVSPTFGADGSLIAFSLI